MRPKSCIPLRFGYGSRSTRTEVITPTVAPDSLGTNRYPLILGKPVGVPVFNAVACGAEGSYEYANGVRVNALHGRRWHDLLEPRRVISYECVPRCSRLCVILTV